MYESHLVIIYGLLPKPLFHHQYHQRTVKVKFWAENVFFFCPELVPGSKRFIFLPRTENVDISSSIWSFFIKKIEMFNKSEPVSIYDNRKCGNASEYRKLNF